MAALEGFTNHSPPGIHHSCPDMTSQSITVTVTVTQLHTHAHTPTHMHTQKSGEAYSIFIPPHYKYHYV